MLETSARLLSLLSLLQSRPAWSGPELAERLEVSTRTIRNDIERLRTLGYPVDAERGPTGHYRLGAGAKLPPLLLDDEEAVGLAVALRVAAGVVGIEETATRTLAKLEQVLPHRLHRKVSAIQSAVSRGPENTGTNVEDPEVDPATLGTVAAAIRDAELLRFDQHDQRTLVEPYRLVSWERRWYLVARDPRTRDWSIHRLDWMTLGPRDGRRFVPQPLEEGEYADLVLRTVATTGWVVHARIHVRASASEVLSRIHAAVGVVEPVDDDNCVLLTGADSVETVAVYIGMLGIDFWVESPDALVDHLREVGERYARAVADSPQPLSFRRDGVREDRPMQTITGQMATDRPERYAKQLASHWAKRGPATEEDGATVLRWEDGQVISMLPQDGTLAVEVSVPEGEDLERFAQVVKVHLERFGQRDELTVIWDD